MADALTHHQGEIVSQVLTEESAKREHVVVHLSGAHAYGFASPDSDVDLKAIHVVPTAELLGLHKSQMEGSRFEVILPAGGEN